MTVSFVERVLEGTASCEDIDDYVERWHEGDGDVELHEYLGLSWDEYALWVEKSDSIEPIIARKKSMLSS